MNGFMKSRVLAILVALYALVENSHGQGTLQITFDGSPIQPPGTVYSVQQYTESEMRFTPLGVSFGRAGGGIQQLPENGTAYLQAAFTQALMFGRVDGGMFDFLSVDLAEYSTVVPNAVTVQFIGYYMDGSTITETRTTDGIIDGTGPLVDFQTFTFKGWTGLTRVEIPTAGWSLDNVRVGGVPEPTSGVLFVVGGFTLWILRSRKNRHA